jgi:lipid-A-disaccharide synthase-like uncharacterized protein
VDQESDAPRAIWVIALLGLSGFPISAGVYAYGSDPLAAHGLNVLITWSGVMLGFLGGIRWGLESGRTEPRWTRLAISTLSPIAAWGLVALRGDIDDAWILTGFIAAFILQWLFDQQAPDTPSRFPRLMTVLTLGACVSLALALEKALRM